MLNFSKKEKASNKQKDLKKINTVKNQNKERLIETVYPNDPVYNEFKLVEGNRDLNMANLKNLKNKISEKDLTMDNPILVSPNNYEIYDGQHRYMVCIDLGLPITFIRAHRKYSIEEIIMLNSCNKKWEVKDRVKSWAKLGKLDFKRLQEDMELFNLSPQEIIMACYTSWGLGTSRKNSIKEGILSYKEEQRQMLYKTIEEIQDLITTSKDDNLFAVQKTFSAYCRLRSQPNFNFNRLLNQVKKLGTDKWKFGRTKDDVFKAMLDTYNYGVKQEFRITPTVGNFKPKH